jgi:Caspase domain
MKRFKTLVAQLPRQLMATALCAAGLLTFSATAQAPSDVRIALIIGNSAYPGTMALANPSNDAKDMAATLRNMGFGVIEVIDSDRTKMLEAIERAGKNLADKQGIGMLFYAGHGLQLDWHNFMVPVDAKLNTAADVPKQAVDIETVMKTFQSAGNRMNIVVLDACRDDPFANGKTSSGKGLAPLDAPTGTFLAYATAPGNVAQDGTGKNGLYTGFLLEELKKPSASIENVFKRVRFQVRKASDGAQIPWETTSLEDDFVFNSGIKKVVKLTDEEKEKQFDTEKADWDKIKDSKSVDPFYAFVQKYPNGMLTASAQSAIDRMNAAKTKAYIDKSGLEVRSSSVFNLRAGDSFEYVRKDDYTKLEMMTRKPRVIRVSEGMVYFAGGGTLTVNGESVIDGGSNHSYDPPRANLPIDGLALGKKWTTRVSMTLGSGPSAGQTRWTETDGRVLGIETVTVPAGTFKTYKIENKRMNAWGYRETDTSWVIPELGITARRVFEGRNVRGGNADRWSEELVLLNRAKPS